MVGRQLGIRPVRNDDYTIVPNLWGGTVARPGALKTFAIDEGTKPLKSLVVKARDRFQADSDLNTSKQTRIKAEIEAIKSEMVSAAKGKGDKALDDLETELTTKSLSDNPGGSKSNPGTS